EDLLGIQATDLQNLPGNYLMKFCACILGLYHALTGPQISLVAEDHKIRITEEVYSHVNSSSVLRSYRRLGLARKLVLL
ncbi:hypothetical protein B0H11DRAFT_1671486, partial [Mycena galericulata]